MLNQPVIEGMPAIKTVKSIATKPITTSSRGFGRSRACGKSFDVLRQTRNTKRFLSCWKWTENQMNCEPIHENQLHNPYVQQ